MKNDEKKHIEPTRKEKAKHDHWIDRRHESEDNVHEEY